MVAQLEAERELFSKTGNAIYNDAIRIFLKNRVGSWFESSESYDQLHCQHDFIEQYKNWIVASQLNHIEGLESFAAAHVTLGVTQSIDLFHYRVALENRRLRVFRGEYPYSRDTHPFDWDFGFLDDFPLAAKDAVILSCPFSGSGRMHSQQEDIIRQCAELKVPLLLDMAWFGTCSGIKVDLSHPGISEVAFSVTKSLTCGNYRVGMRLVREDKKDRISLQNQWQHGVHLNTRIALELLREFSADSHYLKYAALQDAVCRDHGLIPSSCVHIAQATGPEWTEFDRDGSGNRINLREVIKRRLRQQSKPIKWSTPEV